MHSSLWQAVCCLALSSQSVLWGSPSSSTNKALFTATDFGNEIQSYFMMYFFFILPKKISKLHILVNGHV